MILGTITPQQFALQVPTVVSAISLTATGNTSILSFTGGPGILNTILFDVQVALSANAITAVINITIDGGAVVSVPLYTALTTFDAHATSMSVSTALPGNAVNNYVTLSCNVRFANSLSVALNITATTLTTGTGLVGVNWSHN